MPASTSTFTPNYEIRIGNITIRKVNYLRISQRFEGHHSFEISVAPSMLAGQANSLAGLAESVVGIKTSIKINQTREGATSQSLLFEGAVTSIRLIKGQSQTNTYLISGLSSTMFLEVGKNTQSFAKFSLSDIVKNIVANFTAFECSPVYTNSIPYVTQYDEDDFHFLQRLAETYGEWFYYNGEKVIFGKNARPSSPTIALTNDSNLFDLEYSLRALPFKFKTSYYNYEVDERFFAYSEDETISNLPYFRDIGYNNSNANYRSSPYDISFNTHYATISELKTAVKLKKSEQTTKLAVLSGRTPEMELKIGGLISVKEPNYTDGRVSDTIDYGIFVVTRLNHSIDTRNVYQAFFEAVPQDTAFPPVDYNIIPRHAKPQLADVMDIDDPMKLGRVRVEFLWQLQLTPGKDKTPWIRVLNTMSHKSSSYFIPELRSTVMVDFEFGNPDLPFVIGAAYHHNNKPEELFTPDNHLKGIITRGKNHIIIDDTEGKEKILIYNKDKKNKIELSLDGTHISIKSEGNINIDAGGDISMSASNIKMNAKTDWKVKADHAVIETQAGDIELIAGKDLNVSGVNATIVAIAEMKISGTIVEIEADVSAKFKASATLDIDGGAMATLKGAMVMIN